MVASNGIALVTIRAAEAGDGVWVWDLLTLPYVLVLRLPTPLSLSTFGDKGATAAVEI